MIANTHCRQVLRMENLTASFNALMGEVGLSDVQLSRRRTSFASSCKDLSMLDNDTRAMIRRIYGQDFAQFGYPE